jgi:CD151 antigen
MKAIEFVRFHIFRNFMSVKNCCELFFSSFFHSQYIVLLILVFLFELSAGVFAYIYERNVPEELNMTLSDTFAQNYAISERHTNAIDLMQQEYGCCGANRFEEYRQSVWLKSRGKPLIRPIGKRVVPDSCCTTMIGGCGASDHPSNIPYTVRGF